MEEDSLDSEEEEEEEEEDWEREEETRPTPWEDLEEVCGDLGIEVIVGGTA